MPICIEISSFIFKISRSQFINEQMDGRTNVQVKNVPLTSLAFMCFHDAERILSEIAKFLVHTLVQGDGRGKM